MHQPPPDSAPLPQHLLEHLTTAVLLFNQQFCLKYINPAGEILLASTARHLQGMELHSLLHCTLPAMQERLQALARGQGFTEREIRLPLDQEHSVTVDCTMQPIRDSQGNLEVLVELQQLDHHLRISREEQLLIQNQAAQRMLRTLAHEIKNPLGGLRGAAQLLEQELADPELREYTGIIISEADRLKNLVNRMQGPNKLPRQVTINIHHILERVRQLVEVELKGHFLFERDYDPSIPEMLGDPDQLIQALLNIILNATRAAGEQGRVILRTRILRQFPIGNVRHRLVIRVDIEDNGPGIAPEHQESIFFPMVSHTEGGVGLGLSIAQSLINQHQGLIECQSRPGETLFSILLPVESRHDEE